MRRSHLSTSFLGAFLSTTFALQWWQRATYPASIWLIVGILGCCSMGGLLSQYYKRERDACPSGRRASRGSDQKVNERPGRHPSLLGGLFSCSLSFTLGISLAFLTVQRATHQTTERSIERFANGETYEMRGFIALEPDERPMQTKFTVEVSEITDEDGAIHNVDGRVLATDRAGWPPHSYGDDVLVTGKLTVPGKIGAFDYESYLAIDAIQAIVPYATVTTINAGAMRRGWRKLPAWMYALKDRFESRIDRVLPEPHASLLSGLLTGSRRGIPDSVNREFRRAGLSHIVAISGYNITIILALLAGVLFWLPVRWRIGPLATAITLFTILVGASSSVVRAAIMGVLGLLALSLGRRSESRLTILLAASIMLAFNPKYLWYDAGFQLSFLAVIGMNELQQAIRRFLHFVPEQFALRESLTATLAAQIATTPLSVYLFGQLSLIAPLSNILVAPFVPLAMLFGFLAVIASSIFLPLGQLIGAFAWGYLELIMLVAHWSARVPLGSVSV